MPKLPAIKPRQIIRFLEQHGFALDHASGSHYVYYHLHLADAQLFRSIIVTYPKAL